MSLSQEIESKIPILDLVNRYLQTKKAGVNYKALCPFHHEKTPSFVISPQKNIAYCFSCHKGGGPIHFLMEIEKLEYREAVQILAKEAGMELKTDFSKEKGEKSSDIYALYRATSQWYHQALFLPENARALAYLTDRRLSRETIERFELGYSHAPRDLFYHLKQLGFDEKAILDSGIFVSTSRDKFFGRIIFPIANFLGHVVAFTGRVLDGSLPKYLNSPASKIFDKSSILYGLHLAKGSASKEGAIIIVEGQMDTIALHQAGYTNTVGISGTALTTSHVKILKRFTKKIYLSLDSDTAGVNATFASIESTMNQDLDIRIVSIPNGKDPDGFIESGGNFQECLDQARSPTRFFLEEGGRKYDLSSTIGKKMLLDEIILYITNITSHTERDLLLTEVSNHMGVSKDALYTELREREHRKKKTEKRPEGDPEGEPQKSLRETIAENLAGYISAYDFFDLFSQEFRYTLEDLAKVRDFSLLPALLARGKLDEYMRERLTLAELAVETESAEKTDDKRREIFRDLLRKLHTELFLIERDSLLQGISLESPEYLTLYTRLLARAKSLGLSQDILQK